MRKVYELECQNADLIRNVVELKEGLKVGDAVWANDGQCARVGMIHDLRLSCCFVKFAGNDLSVQFRYEDVEKLSGA